MVFLRKINTPYPNQLVQVRGLWPVFLRHLAAVGGVQGGGRIMRTEELTKLAAQAMAAHGLVLVQARWHGGGQHQTLQVLAEKPDGSSAGLDDYAAASRTLGAQLDVADAVSGRYVLEVSSPGLDRPLSTPPEFARFVGRQAKVELTAPLPVGGTQLGALTGQLLAADAQHVTLAPLGVKAGTPPIELPYRAIRGAWLHPSADELAAVMRGQLLPGDVRPATADKIVN